MAARRFSQVDVFTAVPHLGVLSALPRPDRRASGRVADIGQGTAWARYERGSRWGQAATLDELCALIGDVQLLDLDAIASAAAVPSAQSPTLPGLLTGSPAGARGDEAA